MCPWSWYMATTMSYQPPSALEKTVSGGMGPWASMPSRRASSMAGEICSISSRPNSPPSPQWGLSPATPMRGWGMPMSRQALSAMPMTSSTRALVARSQASRRETWVETWTTRRSLWASIMV